MGFSPSVFWYLFSNQFSTILNYFYYPYLISGTITYCDDFGCTDFKILPYFISVILVDFLLLIVFLKFWINQSENPRILLDD